MKTSLLMKSTLTLGVLTLMTLGGMAPSYGEPTEPETPAWVAQWDGERGPQGRSDRWMDNLNLTGEQRQELRAIRQKYQPRLEQTLDQLRTRQNELSQLMASNASDGEIRAKHRQVAELRQQLGSLRFESMLESRKVLTVDQRKQFTMFMEGRRNKMMPRNGNFNPGPN